MWESGQLAGPNLMTELAEDWGVYSCGAAVAEVHFTLKNGARKMVTAAQSVFTVEKCDGVLLASRAQVPLMLSYGMTVHRAQGLHIRQGCVHDGWHLCAKYSCTQRCHACGIWVKCVLLIA